jgi:hypothetical protein
MDSPVGPIAAWFEDLVSDRVGIVRSLTRISRGATEPEPPVFYQAVLAHFDFRKAPCRGSNRGR